MTVHKVRAVTRPDTDGELWELYHDGALLVGSTRAPRTAAQDALMALGAGPHDTLELYFNDEADWTVRCTLGFDGIRVKAHG